MKFSVILPVYNVAPYLKECLDSIFKYEGELEVIAIDDGSTDQSGNILDEYSDERLKVIHKENEGVYKTWQMGVKIATGEYIIFIDPDDYIEPTLFCDMQELLQKKSYDLIQYNWVLRDGDKFFPSPNYKHYEKGSFEGEELDGYLRRHLYMPKKLCDCFSFYRWGKVFKTSLLKAILPELMEDITMFDDESVVMPYLTRIKSLYVSEKVYYVYRINRPGSICYSEKVRAKYMDCRKVLAYIQNFADGAIIKDSKRTYVLRNYYGFVIEAIENKDYALAEEVLHDEWMEPVLKEEKGFKFSLLRHRHYRTFCLLRKLYQKMKFKRAVV